MPSHIKISNAAHAALRAAAKGKWKETGVQVADGWHVPFKAETLERLCEYQMEGETLSDTIERVAATFDKPKH